MSTRLRRLKTPSKEKEVFASNTETPVENASVTSASSTGLRGRRKIRRTEDLINLSLVFPAEKKLASAPKTRSPNKNGAKEKHLLELNKSDEVKGNLGTNCVSPCLKSPISKKKKKKQIDKNNTLQTISLQDETSVEGNVITNHLAPNQCTVDEKMEEQIFTKCDLEKMYEERSVVPPQASQNRGVNSDDKEKQENCVLPPENVAHKRKVVKAKRLLKAQKVEEKPVKIENCTTKMGIAETEAESKNSLISELQQALKNRRSKLQRQPHVTEDVVSAEVKNSRNEESEEVEDSKKNASVITIDESIIEETDEPQNTVTVTTLKSTISPSTSSEMPSPIHFKSPIEKILHFDTSNEEIHPSTSGTIEQTAKKRRTFELESSVNDITLLKSVSKNDSIRMASFPSSDEDMSEPKLRQSKITLRRKWEIKSDRLSKVSPPWLNPGGLHEAPESDTDVENTPPRVTQKSQCDSLRKNLLTKGVSESLQVEKTPLQNERKSRSFSASSIKKAKSSTAKKHVSSVKLPPNFAAIHQKRFDGMENLSEYVKRKEERAQKLLSGQKPLVFKTPTCKKKVLKFAPGTHDKEQPFNFIPLPSTPMPRKRIQDSGDSLDSPKRLQAPKIFNNFNSPPPRASPKPRNVEKTESVQEQNKILTPKLQYNFKNLKLPEFKFGSGIPQFNFGKPDPSVGNNYHRFGFKSRPQLAKKEEIKAMIVNKSKPMKASVESRRVVIKGVRSNRRFDLLMEMRKGK